MQVIEISFGNGSVAKLGYENGETFILLVTDDLYPAALRWINYGLGEWTVREGERGRFARFTPSSSPDFFPRLKEHLEGQFSPYLKIELSIQE